MNLANIAYWFYNLMPGNKLATSVRHLETAYQTGAQPDPTAILLHAAHTVPFYRSLGLQNAPLARFPVVGKDTIKASPDHFLSESFRKHQLIAGKTSGTHGLPFGFFWDANKALLRTAEVIYHNTWIGYRVGDLHLLNAVGLNKSKFKLLLQNEIVHNPRFINDQWMEEQRQTLIDKKVPFYVGYGSVIDRFSQFCLDRGDSPKLFSLQGIISTAEYLSEHARARAERVFGCPVLRRYATLESGILAHECPEERRYHINTGNYFIEFLQLDTNDPARPGEMARIVITDLISRAMPLIRYEIGDLAVIDPSPCPCGRKSATLKELMGRTTDNLINDKGKLVSWLDVNDAMWSVNGIQRFQFVQHDYHYCELNIVSTTGYNSKHLLQVAKNILGDSIEVRINDVESIAGLGSGKTPNIVNRVVYSTEKVE